jgi:high-affinity nickel-transport protein
VAAYLLGARHAFDADHIVAVDDTVRFMLQTGKRPLGIGFFFSLGHATVVFAMTLATLSVASVVRVHLPQLQAVGANICAVVSGAFLLLIGMLNLRVLVGIVRMRRARKRGLREATGNGKDHEHLDHLLRRRGLLSRLWGGRFRQVTMESWHMYPLGILFGMGFDTASEVSLLVVTASASAQGVPVAALLSLPALFAAGMTVLDTTDGIVMAKAYGWALVEPSRKLSYNMVVTALSVVVALGVGAVTLMQLFTGMLHFNGAFVESMLHMDFALLGYVIVGTFLLAWVIAVLWWKKDGSHERNGSLRDITTPSADPSA